MYDVIFRNGLIVDGTGAPGYRADLAVKGDAIAVVGRIDGEARQTVDAAGKVVAPGFIDLHGHADFQFFVDPTADSKITQGVTLELVGNCGMSFCAPLSGLSQEDLDTRLGWYETDWRPSWASFSGYLDALEHTGKTLNIATQVGHGTVRKAVLGMEMRAPDLGELKRMQSMVAEALDAGAMGFSTGLSMAPGVYSMTQEVIALSEPAAKSDKLYSTHARDSGDEGAGLFVALTEALEVGRRTGGRVQISHLKCNGSTRGSAEAVLRLIDDARRGGIDVAADQYPYIAASGPMSGNVFPRWALEGGRGTAIERVKDADLRAEVRAHMEERIDSIGGPDRIMVASYQAVREYEGMSLGAISDDMGCDPAEALIRLFEGYDAQLILSGMAENDVDEIAAADFVAVGSDGSSLKSTGPLSAGNPHPRSYGTFPRFLALMVRDKGIVTLEDAVRKMTALPA